GAKEKKDGVAKAVHHERQKASGKADVSEHRGMRIRGVGSPCPATQETTIFLMPLSHDLERVSGYLRSFTSFRMTA
ncbi:MAG: hypothetical protein WA946_12675, partial [Nitrospirota bacterium]